MLSGPGELADLRVCVGLCADLPLQDSLGLLKAVVPVISLIIKSNTLKINLHDKYISLATHFKTCIKVLFPAVFCELLQTDFHV